MRVRRRATFISLCLALGLFLLLGPVYQDEARAYESEEQQLLELINEYRQANDLAPLVPSETLSASAGHHSEDMEAYDYFSHDTEESSYYPKGSDFVERMAQEGYPTTYAYVGENIAWGQPTAEEVFEDWRLSPEHDATMLNEWYTAAGIGHVGSYWTADFGSES
ncbi:MAG: CAP domain-containing protein [Actinobacteria bacterium]|nr:CAP domain-containing protein [Actinomycetota bacterium]